MNPVDAVRQRALASATGLDEGHVGRVVGRLMEMGLVERDDSGVRATDADRLLDAWRDEYRFDKHSVIQRHIAAAANESVVQRLARTIAQSDMDYAVTGLTAAWHWTGFARYGLTTVHLKDSPRSDLLEKLGFREDQRGANAWLVVPQDESVFDGSSDLDGVCCAHPIQVYLDLKSHPERAAEAAEEMRDRLILRSNSDQ